MRKKTRIARAVDCVLTPEQYARRTHKTPYLYTLGTGDQALTFVGARHTNDESDELFDVITDQFEAVQPDVVFVEGVQSLQGAAGTERFIRQLSTKEAIARGGESIFTVQHALERGVPWLCPEPSDAALMRYLVLQLYTPEILVSWYVLRLLDQYHRRDESMPFSAYIVPFLAYLEKATQWPGVTYSYQAALDTAERVLGHTPNTHNAERAHEYTDPIPWPNRWEQQTLFNEITRAAVQYRDKNIIERVSNELFQNKRVLVVYGAGHAVMQEPAYAFLLG